jgi:cellulose synthase (UDP-forming)
VSVFFSGETNMTMTADSMESDALPARLPTAAIVAWFALSVAAGVLAAVPADLEAQCLLSGVGLALVIALVQRATDNPNDWRRAAVLIFGLFLSIRYMVWRTFNTLGVADPFSMIAANLLYFAEAYAFTIFALGIFVNFYPLRRPNLRLRPGDPIPTVDILVPSYNENAELLEVTLRCCLAVRYPQDKKRIFLLDDGGTDQKRNDRDIKKRQEAISRHHELRKLCERLGVGYLTRERNEHAKAGNINAALDKTDGELVLILDADHVPTSDMLERTVPWFNKDPLVFLVQSPHFMINPDPIDRNLLSAFRRMPAENEMFYVTIQRGLDFWDSSFFCGSAAVLRRTALELVGGLTGDSITEDAETALELHARGLKSVYVDQPMVGGLAPESFTGFVVQRMRWAQGMTQIMLLKLPKALGKMRWYQAVSYINACLFWMFPLGRLIFLLAPCLYLFFGLKIYSASTEQILIYALPHVVGAQICNSMLFGRTRWPLISELYEIMQSIYSMMAIIQVFRNPRKPQFVVTPKSEVVEEEFISPLVRPFYILFFCVVAAMIAGIIRFIQIPDSRPLTGMVLVWNMLNLTLISAAFGALLERRQRRSAPRMPLQVPAVIEAPNGQRLSCTVEDISAGGFRLTLGQEAKSLRFGDQVFLHVWVPSRREEHHFKLEVRSAFPVGRQRGLGCRFTDLSEHDRDMMYALMYGDSESWAQFIARRTRPMPFLRAVVLVFKLSYKPIIDHVTHLVANVRHFAFRSKALRSNQTFPP